MHFGSHHHSCNGTLTFRAVPTGHTSQVSPSANLWTDGLSLLPSFQCAVLCRDGDWWTSSLLPFVWILPFPCKHPGDPTHGKTNRLVIYPRRTFCPNDDEKADKQQCHSSFFSECLFILLCSTEEDPLCYLEMEHIEEPAVNEDSVGNKLDTCVISVLSSHAEHIRHRLVHTIKTGTRQSYWREYLVVHAINIISLCAKKDVYMRLTGSPNNM